MKKFILLILMSACLQGCSSVTEGFKLKKGNTGDEYDRLIVMGRKLYKFPLNHVSVVRPLEHLRKLQSN